jgi:hypothetical protein
MDFFFFLAFPDGYQRTTWHFQASGHATYSKISVDRRMFGTSHVTHVINKYSDQ